MRRRWAVALLAAGVLGGCVSYQPAPVDVGAMAAMRQATTVDPAAVRRELGRIAPDYQWDGVEWNRLTLFAAALTTSPALASARATLSAAEAEAAASRVRPGPTFTLTTEYAFDAPESSPWLYGLAGDIGLDLGGRRQGRIKAADVAARRAAYQYLAAAWQLRTSIRRAVDAQVSWTVQTDLTQDLVVARQRQFEAVQRRVAAGEVARFELDRVRADLADATRMASTAESQRVSAGLDLTTALGVPSDGLDLNRLNAPVDPDLQRLPAVTEAQRSDALQLRPDILDAVAAYDAREAQLRSAVAAQYPALRLGPGYTWERGLAKLPFSLSLSLPSLDDNHAVIRAAEARRAEAARQLEGTVASVEADIARADAAYGAAWDVLDLIRRQTLPTAAALAAQADRQLAAGSLNRADWAASRAGLISARIDEVAALRDVLAAEAGLEDALRRPLRGPEGDAISPANANEDSEP